MIFCFFFFFQAEDGIRDYKVTGVQTCALPISVKNARSRLLTFAVLIGFVVLHGGAQSPAYSYRKVMVPVRDGIKLETVILTPANASSSLPILFRRTPYGVPSSAAGVGEGSQKELARDGY